MKDSLILEGKIYISAKRAAKIINYAQDYIGQLCRSGKLDCKMIGRSWYVTEESLLAHREQAVDATQERVLKVVKSIKPETKIEVAPTPVVAPTSVLVASPVVTPAPVAATPITPAIVSPILPVVVEEKTSATPSPLLSAYKYEVENKPALPAITKKLPQSFSLPKKVTDLTTTPFAAKIVSKNISKPEVKVQAPVQKEIVEKKIITPAAPAPAPIASPIQIARPQVDASGKVAVLTLTTPKTVAIALVAVLIVVSGFMFTIAGRNIQKITAGETRSSITKNFVSGVMKTLGFGTKSPIASIPRSPEVKNEAALFNGIGVIPSTGSATEDELAKQKIQTSFSDEVVINPDESGTAGVIKPVFKEGTGDDFMYVLVPVKEEKK